jgi:hypothetical protein
MQSLTAAQKKLAKRSGDAEAADQERDEDEEKAPPKPAGETKYVIGIDLGTTYSCVGVWKDGGVQILANEDGERTLPSWITVTEEGVFTGNQARALALRYPQYTLYDVKRFIGQRFSDSGVQKVGRRLSARGAHSRAHRPPLPPDAGHQELRVQGGARTGRQADGGVAGGAGQDQAFRARGAQLVRAGAPQARCRELPQAARHRRRHHRARVF